MKAWYTNKYLHMATSVVAEKISMSTVVLVQIAGEQGQTVQLSTFESLI